MLRGLYHLAFNPRARAEWRWLVLTAITKRLMPGYRLPWPHMAWWNDEQFNAFLKRFDEYNGHNSERRWTIAQLCKLAKTFPVILLSAESMWGLVLTSLQPRLPTGLTTASILLRAARPHLAAIAAISIRGRTMPLLSRQKKI
jgi:hypothetical protein